MAQNQSASTFRVMTLKNLTAIMTVAGRKSVTEAHVGKNLKLRVMSVSSPQDVMKADELTGEMTPVESARTPNTKLQKIIVTLNATSEIGKSNPEQAQRLREAIAAEKAGETDKAAELYTLYASRTRVSFNILLPNALADKLQKNMTISGDIVKITTERGSLLSVDPKSVCIVPAEDAAQADFNPDFILGISAPEPADETATVHEGADVTIDAETERIPA